MNKIQLKQILKNTTFNGEGKVSKEIWLLHLYACISFYCDLFNKYNTKPLKDYLKEAERTLKKLSSVSSQAVDLSSLKEELKIRIFVSKEFLKYYSAEKKDYFKDLFYLVLFGIFKKDWKLSYDESLEAMSKISVLCGLSGVSCKEELAEGGKFYHKHYPSYTEEGCFCIQNKNLRIEKGKRIKSLCSNYRILESDCAFENCVKEADNIRQRLTRLRKLDTAIYAPNKRYYGSPLSWPEMVNEKETIQKLLKEKKIKKGYRLSFKDYPKEKLIDGFGGKVYQTRYAKKVSNLDVQDYLVRKVEKEKSRYGLHINLIRSILKHYGYTDENHLKDLLDDKSFSQALNSCISIVKPASK